MKTKNILFAGVLALAAGGALAVPVSQDFDVEAFAHSHNAGAGAGLATGIVFGIGDTYSVSVDPSDTWVINTSGAAWNNPGGEWNADGITTLSAYNSGGLTANYSALVGRIGTGDYFLLGTNYTGMVGDVGELRLFNWDSDTFMNSGSVLATVTYDNGIAPVPLPASGLLLFGALGLFGAARRRC